MTMVVAGPPDRSSTGPRYGLYFAPPPGSPLHRFGSAWLGRDAWTGAALSPPLAGVTSEEWRSMVAEPARYGFHATLKPPLRLTPGAEEAEFLEALERFAATRAPVEIGHLRLGPLGTFLALQPVAAPPSLSSLAAACVDALDRWRAPPDAAELARRRSAGLDARGEELLARWGYPYVMDRFRFHMTLTGALPEIERGRALQAVAPLFEPIRGERHTVDALTVFRQEGPGAPFLVLRAVPLGGRP